MRPLCELDVWEPGWAEAVRLRELRLLAQDRLVDGLLASGQHREAVAAAAAFVEQEPLREQRWAGLALAQYRAGRQGDALRSITRARRPLADELGIDPRSEVVELERAVLAQDPALMSAVVGPVSASDVCPHRGLAGYDVDDAEYFFGRERAVQLVDLASRTLLGSPIDLGRYPVGGRGAINAVFGALSGDGGLMAVQTSRGVVVWDLDPDHVVAAACAVAGRNLTETEWRDHLAPLGPYRKACPHTT